MTPSFTVPIDLWLCSWGFEAEIEASIEGEGTLLVTPGRPMPETEEPWENPPTLTIPAGPFLALLAQLTAMERAEAKLKRNTNRQREAPRANVKAKLPIIIDSGSVEMDMSISGGGTSVRLFSLLMTIAGEIPFWATMPVEGLQAALEYIATYARTQRTLADTAGDVQKLLADVYGS